MNGPALAPAGSPGGPRELFVYYHVPLDAREAVCHAAAAAQQALARRHPGLRTGLLWRPRAEAGRATVMETYARPGAPHGVDEGLADDIALTLAEALAVQPCGERHVESFVRCV